MSDLYIIRKQISDTMENIFIGIEIETCFGSEDYNHQYLYDAHKQYYLMLLSLINIIS